MTLRTTMARALVRSALWAIKNAASPAFDGAGTGTRMTGWNPSSASLNALLFGSGEMLRRRSRDMVRKNPYAESAVTKYVANAIGTGIRPRSLHPDPARRDAIQEAWRRWTDEADAHGTTNLYGLQALAIRSMFEGGDCFGRLRARRPGDGLSVPLQLELLESEMVPLAKSERRSHGDIRGGIEFDGIGRRSAYHMYRSHPGDMSLGLGSMELARVPAENVVHVFRPLRPGQVRGVPALSTVLLRLYELDQYQDAELVRKKIAAMLTGFITKGLDEDGNPVLAGAEAISGEDAVDLAKLEPGTFQLLQPGEDVKFAGSTDLGAGTGDFVKALLRSVAAGAGVTAEQLTGDLSEVNYSSIRAGLLEFRRECEQFQKLFFEIQFCRPIWRRFIRDAILSGALVAPDFRRDPEAYYGARWVPQGFKWVDPLKEVAALVKAIRAGLISRTDAAQASGYDPEVIDAQIAADNARADGLGLSFDSDGRRAEKGGADKAPEDDDDGDEEKQRSTRAA